MLPTDEHRATLSAQIPSAPIPRSGRSHAKEFRILQTESRAPQDDAEGGVVRRQGSGAAQVNAAPDRGLLQLRLQLRQVANPNPLAVELDFRFDYPRIAREILACGEFFNSTPPYRWQVDDALSGRIPFASESLANYESIDTFGADGIRRNGLASARTAYLRDSTEIDVRRHPSFRLTKGLRHSSWYWRPELAGRIPYTMRCIESLPYRAIGLVRAFLYENTFMPTHRDTIPDADGQYDRSKARGISLVPMTGQVGLKIWDDEDRKAVEFKGNALLFDDSNWHGVPMTTGIRITLRIFGDLDLH